MRLVHVVLLVAALLAGCASTPSVIEEAATGPDATVPTVTTAPLAPDATVEAPTWAVGDAWVVETRNGDETAEATLVVVSADANGYVTATTDERTATYDAAFDVSYLGKIRGSDLAGAQRDEPVKFFDFPLADGKAWTATWDQLQVNLTAKFAPHVSTPLGPQPGFTIEGTGPDGSQYVSYDFVPALAWWSHLDFAAGYGLTVKAVKHDWTGEYLSGTAKGLLSLATVAPVAASPAGTFTVDKDQTTVILTLAGSAARAYARGFALVDPNHQPYNPEGIANYQMDPNPSRVFATAFLPPTAGQWDLVAPAFHDPDGFFLVTVQEIAIAKKTL